VKKSFRRTGKIPFQKTRKVPFKRTGSRVDEILTVILVIAIIIAISMTLYVIITPKQGEKDPLCHNNAETGREVHGILYSRS
jgi:uncharacterized membrane protein